MDRYTARQPIFDKFKKVAAYELLYRESEVNLFPSHVSSNAATSAMLVNTFLDTKVELITEDKPALINFSEDTLLNGFTKLAPSDKIIIEVLETVEPTEELYHVFEQLFHSGYKIALDDFTFDPKWDRFLPFVKIIKVDVITHPLTQIGDELVRLKKIFNGDFLAEKVETYEEFDLAKQMGFTYFQGYFFCKPEIIQNKSLDFSNNLLMKIYKEAVKPKIDIDKIDRLFKQDTGLTTKLLRYMNNIMPNAKEDARSTREVLIQLGTESIRRFTLVLVTSEMSGNKPNELLKTSIYRARFCEQMVTKSHFPDYSDRAFLVGMFSTLDAVLDLPISDIMDVLPIDTDIKLALVQNVGLLAGVLNIIRAYEKGDWKQAEEYCTQIGLSLEHIHITYEEAIAWQSKEVSALESALI